MYLVVIAWLYVTLMMAIAEATSPIGSVLGAIVTFVLYGLLPLSILVYILGTPGRKRTLRLRQMAEQQAWEQAQAATESAGAAAPEAGSETPAAADSTGAAAPDAGTEAPAAADSAGAAAPDAGSEAPAAAEPGRIAAVREER